MKAINQYIVQQYHVLYWNNHKYVIHVYYKQPLHAWGHLLWRKQKRKCYLSLQFISKQQLTPLLWRSLFQKCPIVTIYGLQDNDVFRKNEHIRNFSDRRKLSEISNQRRKESLEDSFFLRMIYKRTLVRMKIVTIMAELTS